MASIRDYFEGKGIILRESFPNLFIECPGCHTRKQKCSIHLRKGIGRCFRASCTLNEGFHFTRIISLLEGCSASQAYYLSRDYMEGVEQEFKARGYGINHNYPKGCLPLEDLYYKAQEEKKKNWELLCEYAAENLKNKRHLSAETIQNYQIGVGYDLAPAGSLYGMVVVPVFFNHEIVSYTGRSIEVQGTMLADLKFYTPTEADQYLLSGQILFNCDVGISHAKKIKNLVLVEDVWSAINLNAISILGAKLTDEQIYILLNNYEGPVTICLDNDKGGRDAAERIAIKLSKYYSDIRIATPPGVDPDDDIPGTLHSILNGERVNPFELSLKRSLF